MASFWDTLIFRVHAGLCENFYHGKDTAAELLELAHAQGLLTVPSLNHLSILLILLTCSSADVLHREAAAEYLRRGLTPDREWEVLREALPPRFIDWHLLAYFGEPRQRALLSRMVHTLYLPSLVRFHARLALTEYSSALAYAAPHVQKTLDGLHYGHIVKEELLSQLYERVLLVGWPVAPTWPTPAPVWKHRIDPSERLFLNCCLRRLSGPERYVLYLSVYAQLNAHQIAGVFQSLPSSPPAQAVVQQLRRSWKRVLRCMGRRQARLGRLGPPGGATP